MNGTKKILSAINKIDRRIDGIEKRVSAVEEATAAKIERQQASIEALTRKVAELAHSDAAVWKSRDRLEIGIDRETAYEAFRELGIRRRDALKTLEALGILVRAGENLTKNVFAGGRFVRAVVVMDKDIN